MSITIDLEQDHLHEECGVFGIYSKNKDFNVAYDIFHGLYALQHRGQESAGIAVVKDRKIHFHKQKGLVSTVFQKENLKQLKGSMGVGHVRYSTTGNSSALQNAQPLVVNYKKGSIALAHNGNLINAYSLRTLMEDKGIIFQSTNDSEVIANLVAQMHGTNIEEALKATMNLIKGSYALVIVNKDKLIGVRDIYGNRPLVIGKREDAYVLASESCALDAVGAEMVRDVEPGEIVTIDEKGIHSIFSSYDCKKAVCIFEYVYFARPDSIIEGISVYHSRYQAGKILAQESPVDADIVISVPDSGTPAAIGYSKFSGIPYELGLIKNKYVGRTFIEASQKKREAAVRIKLNPLRSAIEGKRVVMVDDSIVRGTTSKQIVCFLKQAGAKEVHLRISSPPILNSCYFGIDTPDRRQLIAANVSIPQICEEIGADSLAYISEEGILKTVENLRHCVCTGCFTGNYPMEVPKEATKYLFEKQ
ncbi:amidophosphoribosyltransferase [Garciella nitratireducens]|uniref:Amidophosphoribosyltransferase n=1 Tax=Garciella nitratireducens DSM 15102 TaxID=1121911 RepID=A0A1T4ND38_9FIRM|nr:amidophosphoribosyltransferase [Garciella nitratireducens]RBP44085.1 amidophosphoribosyltransferase [Garciella nitratireducens]SJZ77023.1 amidophosphoribosyltransferase [Garciella nitratireducens DSM 15102]